MSGKGLFRQGGFLSGCGGPLAFLAAGCLLVGAFRLARKNRPAMEWVAAHISVPFKRAASALVDPLPFSGAEAVCLLVGCGALAFLVRGIWRQIHGQGGLGSCLLVLAALAVWIYAGVCLFWGVHYYTESFEEKAGMTNEGVSLDQLAQAALWFREKVNETAPLVKRDENGDFGYTWQEIFADSPGLYDGVLEEYPFLAGPERSPKPALFSKLMSASNFTGYLFPFLGESTLNVDCPVVFIPVTVAHEFSHQRGVAQEEQANFVGIEACIASDKPAYVYSGYLFGYLHLTNALWEADPERWARVEEGLCAQAKQDMALNNAYWAQYQEKVVANTMQSVYENFLYSYDQSMGIRSYGACVDLLAQKYGTQEN